MAEESWIKDSIKHHGEDQAADRRGKDAQEVPQMTEYVSLEEMQEAMRWAEEQAKKAQARYEAKKARDRGLEAHKQRLEREALQSAVKAALKKL